MTMRALALLLGWVALVQELSRLSFYLPKKSRALVQWLRAQTLEVFATLALVLLRIATLFGSKKPVGNSTGFPILLVHGYLNGGFVWEFQKRFLAKRGFGPIYTIDLGMPFRSIRLHATRLHEMAAMIAEQTNHQPLTLIGHSMGGLVSAYYAARLAKRGSVRKVITVGSPLQGTHVARIGLGACAREMQIGSDLLEELSEALQKRPDLTLYHLATKTDQLVIPYTSSILPSTEPERCYLFDDVGHASMLFSPRVADKLACYCQK